MLSRMAPSSPPDMRTLHLLRTPDILCANDTGYPSVTIRAICRPQHPRLRLQPTLATTLATALVTVAGRGIGGQQDADFRLDSDRCPVTGTPPRIGDPAPLGAHYAPTASSSKTGRPTSRSRIQTPHENIPAWSHGDRQRIAGHRSTQAPPSSRSSSPVLR